MTIFAALQPYADRGSLLALLQQDSLSDAVEALGENQWGANLQTGTVTFTSVQDPSRTLQARAAMIASVAPGPRSALWGWAHPQGGDDSMQALHDRGVQDGVRELSEAELPFPADADTDPDTIAAIAHELGTVATGILGSGPYYSAPLPGGTRMVFLLDAPLPKLTVLDAVTKLPRMLSTGLIRDPRTALWSLATSQGWSFVWTDDAFQGASMTDGATTAQISFDDHGRVTNVQAGAA